VSRRPPSLEVVLRTVLTGETRPPAFVLAGHNGSGKSTLWYERLAGNLKIPLVNADRLTASILPDPTGQPPKLPIWAQQLRDDDERWQRLSQSGVRLFRTLIMSERIPFAFETVFSYWQRQADGSHASKIDDIKELQRAGYAVVLIFVGLASVQLSVLRVQNRQRTGGHGVPLEKLIDRFPRTQAAIRQASVAADLTLMVDNSRDLDKAFTFVRAQRKRAVLFDVRDPAYLVDPELRGAADSWLEQVAGPYRAASRAGRTQPVRGRKR
jgi:predicted ABC-type ATPase